MKKIVKTFAILVAGAYFLLPDLIPGPVDDVVVLLLACNLFS